MTQNSVVLIVLMIWCLVWGFFMGYLIGRRRTKTLKRVPRQTKNVFTWDSENAPKIGPGGFTVD